MTQESATSRNRAHELGRHGETAAAEYLRALGYRILERNLRTKTGEIDILARKGRVLVAVEVKTRRSHPAPEQTAEPRQLARLSRTLDLLAQTTTPRPRFLRVDLCAVSVPAADREPEIRHFPGVEFLPTVP